MAAPGCQPCWPLQLLAADFGAPVPSVRSHSFVCTRKAAVTARIWQDMHRGSGPSRPDLLNGI